MSYPPDMRSERVTVTMTAEQAERLRRTVAAGGAESVSAYVADAIAERLDRDEGLARLESLMGGPPSDQKAIAWAHRVLGIESQANPS